MFSLASNETFFWYVFVFQTRLLYWFYFSSSYYNIHLFFLPFNHLHFFTQPYHNTFQHFLLSFMPLLFFLNIFGHVGIPSFIRCWFCVCRTDRNGRQKKTATSIYYLLSLQFVLMTFNTEVLILSLTHDPFLRFLWLLFLLNSYGTAP